MAKGTVFKDKDVVVSNMVAGGAVGVIDIILLLEGRETKEVLFILLSMVEPLFKAASILGVELEGAMSTRVEDEAMLGLMRVVVENVLVSLLETATVEGAATLECIMIVLQLGRLPLLKERVRLMEQTQNKKYVCSCRIQGFVTTMSLKENFKHDRNLLNWYTW